MKTGIIFDLDGTLLNTLEDLKDAVNYVLRQYGCPERSLEEIRTFVGNGAERLIRLSLPGREDDPPVSQVLADYQTYYNAHSQVKTCPYEGIPEALAAISAKYPIAIVSNKPDVPVKALCKDYFGDVFALGETSDCPRKPAPDMVYKAMGIIGVDRCIYVGDSEVDVVTAKNAGFPCLSVLWGFRDQACMEEVGGTHFCHDPKNLLKDLEEIMNNGQ